MNDKHRAPHTQSDHAKSTHCCVNIIRECLEKTLLVEQHLLPLLTHLDVPGGVIVEFKRRWRNASLTGKNLPALHTICRRYHIPITPEMTEQDMRKAILDAESPE